MIETLVCKYLSGKLSVPVYAEMPEEAGQLEAYVLIERVGLRAVGKGQIASMAFQSYGDTLLHAAQLDERVRHAVESITDLDEIAGVHLVSSYNFTDTRTERYRYQSTYTLSYMEA